MFQGYDQAFNKFKEYPKDQIAIYQISMPQASDPRYQSSFRYLTAHLSIDDNIIRLKTAYEDSPVAKVYFLKGKVESDAIYNLLTDDTLKFMYSSGKKGMKKNMFKFPVKGKILE